MTYILYLAIWPRKYSDEKSSTIHSCHKLLVKKTVNVYVIHIVHMQARVPESSLTKYRCGTVMDTYFCPLGPWYGKNYTSLQHWFWTEMQPTTNAEKKRMND